jgi:hypothetical protein
LVYSISCFFKHIKRRKKGERREDPDEPERKRNEVQDGALWAGRGREKDFWAGGWGSCILGKFRETKDQFGRVEGNLVPSSAGG